METPEAPNTIDREAFVREYQELIKNEMTPAIQANDIAREKLVHSNPHDPEIILMRFLFDTMERRQVDCIFDVGIVDEYIKLFQEAEGIKSFEEDPAAALDFFEKNRAKFDDIVRKIFQYLENHFNLSRLTRVPTSEKKAPPTYYAVTRALKDFNDYLDKKINSDPSNKNGLKVVNYIAVKVEEMILGKYMSSSNHQLQKDKFKRETEAFLMIFSPNDAPELKKRFGNNKYLTGIASFPSLPFAALQTQKYFGEKDVELGNTVSPLDNDSWREIGNMYWNKIKEDANVEVTSATTKLKVGPQNYIVCIDPPNRKMYPWSRATIKIFYEKDFNAMIQDNEIIRDKVKDRPIENINLRTVGETFCTFEVVDGEITMISDSSMLLKNIMGERHYEVLRAYVLNYLAALTIAKYEVKPVGPEIKKNLKQPNQKNSGKRLVNLPRVRIIEIVDETTEPEPMAPDEIKGLGEDEKEKKEKSYAGSHARLLPRNMRPSNKNFLLGVKAMQAGIISPLKAVIFNKKGEYQNFYSFKDVEKYSDFTKRADQLETEAVSKEQYVRFQTFVSEHGEQKGALEVALDVHKEIASV